MTQYRLRIRSAIFHAAIIEIVMASCELIVYEIINRFAPDFFSDKNIT